jgi:hypothetical protein
VKLYIWEGNRISDAYHDDGTLVVLAHDPAEARTVARTSTDWSDGTGPYADEGVRAAIDREPDRTVDLDVPCVVSFNGGGYD